MSLVAELKRRGFATRFKALLLTHTCEPCLTWTDGDGALRKALWAQSEKLVAEAGLTLPERLLERCEAAPVA